MKLGSGRRKMSSLLMRLAMAGGISFGFIGGAFPNCDSDVQEVLVEGMEHAAIAVIESLFQSVDPTDTTGDGGGIVPAV